LILGGFYNFEFYFIRIRVAYAPIFKFMRRHGLDLVYIGFIDRIEIGLLRRNR
jgi:hypothetical protein